METIDYIILTCQLSFLFSYMGLRHFHNQFQMFVGDK